MKKNIIIVLAVFIFGLNIVGLLIPSNTEYGIENYKMDVTILENGNLQVYEMFEMNGKYNGMERIINYKSDYSSSYGNSLSPVNDAKLYNGTGIKLINIKGVKYSNEDIKNTLGDVFTLTNNVSNGDYGVYSQFKSSNGIKYRIYNPSSSKKDFYLEYELENMAITHKDVSELGWNIFTSMNESIANLEVYIHIPNNKDLLRAWAHGPLHGNIEIIDKQTVKVTIKDLKANKPIDVRLVFDKILDTKKTTNQNVFDKIIDIETDLANKANQERESTIIRYVERAEYTLNRQDYENALMYVNNLEDGQLKTDLSNRLDVVLEKITKRENKQKVICSFILVSLGIATLTIYLKHDKELKSKFTGDYYRDFPSEYSPSTVGYLVRKKVNADDLSACILDLIRRKKISYEQISEKDFKFKLINEENITREERLLMDFLFGYDTEVELSELKRKARRNYESFLDDYNSWLNEAKRQAKSERFYESKTGIKLLGVLLSIICFGYSISVQYKLVLHFVVIVLSVVSFIYFVSFSKKTSKGIEQYSKWTALKRFMEDFGNFDEKDLPDINLWEKYLVYAVSLGCAEQLSKTMKIKVENMNQTITNPDLIDIYHFDRMLTFNRSLTRTINTSVQSAYSAKTAASSSSSGSGFGGGFSSGGGSFGGGGGGGRF